MYKKNKRLPLFSLMALFLTLMIGPFCFGADYTMESLPIQDGARLKPFHTYAKEALTLMHGSSSYKGKDKRHAATEVITTWLLAPEAWQGKAFVKIDHRKVKKALGIENTTQKYFSPKELYSNQRLDVLFKDLQGRVELKEKLDPFYQAVQKLQNQMMTFHGITSGYIRVVPSKENPEMWLTLDELPREQAESFLLMLSSYFKSFSTEPGDAKRLEANRLLQSQISDFVAMAKLENPDAYPKPEKMSVEVHYNQTAPFMWSWITYLVASIFAFVAVVFSASWAVWASWVFLFVGFLLHTYGFALRVYLTGRPPVSNMYETVIWVGWGTVLFLAWLSWLRSEKKLLLGGAAVATLCMIVADKAPAVLDASLQPLEPVLRSNLWLIVHVMTITLSYAAFFLALGVGNVGLFNIIRGQSHRSAENQSLVQSCYLCLQVGVVLLTAGTILGGVWADYSWGRFWGWDPKETWALIALLGYLALLHGRLAGWFQNFGVLAGSVIAFNLVIMAWYGVNFVLGAGLHSYGWGAGGIEYVAGFCLLQFIYVFYAFLIHKKLT